MSGAVDEALDVLQGGAKRSGRVHHHKGGRVDNTNVASGTQFTSQFILLYFCECSAPLPGFSKHTMEATLSGNIILGFTWFNRVNELCFFHFFASLCISNVCCDLAKMEGFLHLVSRNSR